MSVRLFFSIFFVLLIVKLPAQTTKKYSDVSYKFNRAKDLYDKQMYGAAQKKFSSILMYEDNFIHSSYVEDAAFYTAMCALKLTHNNAESLITEFVKERPESYNVQNAIFSMADSHFNDKNYRKALEWFEKVDRLSLSGEQLPEYHFKIGFSHFARRDFDKAAKEFFEVRNDESVYGPMSLYFYSHIKYLNENYQTALLGFLDLKDNVAFEAIAPFYIIQIYYLQNRYQDIIDYAPALIDAISGSKTAELFKILGRSYFKTGNYSEAIPYLKQYTKYSDDVTDYDNYEIGFSYYMINDCENAINYFSKIRAMRDTLSQNAAYHMADCYIRLDKKTEAKLAFETASRYRFNDRIREDALFNYALLSFEMDINPFNEAINSFTTFINEYPESDRADQAYAYLVDAFWTASNYKDAISTIEKIEYRSPRLDEAYQRLTFYRGLQLFTALNFNEAMKYFDKSIEYGQYNPKILAQSLYWKAESYFRLGDYREAIDVYTQFINTRGAVSVEEFDLAHYNLGYAYFNLKDYRNANSWFRKFETQKRGKETALLNDALNRIGDCYYINRNFRPAAEYYAKAAEMGIRDTDYSLYQLALSYGGLRQPENKVNSLSELLINFPESEYAANSTFELGRVYNVRLNNADSAKYYFNKLLDDFPRAATRKSALASLGNIYFNERQYEQSLENFKQIISHYPRTNEAYSAIEMIRAIYVEMNKTDEYFEYASTELEDYKITPDEQDSLSFVAAKNLYLEEKFSPALDALTKFLERFPNSRNALEATYYKAELHYYFDDVSEAAEAYRILADAPSNPYKERSTVRAAGLFFKLEKYELSYKYYAQLLNITESRSNRHLAEIGLLRSAYLKKDSEKVIEAAAAVINNERSSEEQIREAHYHLAKAYFDKNQNIRALSIYERLSKEVSSYEGAEAKYMLAKINYLMDNDSIAEETIYEFAGMNSPQQYWIAKSFILLADIFYGRGDNFSAKHTLQSVLNNYANETDGIKDKASDKLTEIIESEKKPKKSDELPGDDDSDAEYSLEDVQIYEDELELPEENYEQEFFEEELMEEYENEHY